MFRRKSQDQTNSNLLSVTRGALGDALALAVSSALRLIEPEVPKNDALPEISLDQVAWHDTPSDCWLIIYDKIYDITEFLYEHPGGEDVLLEYAGRDASIAFRGVGHTEAALIGLEKYLIGVLPDHEKIYNKRENRLLRSLTNSSIVPVGTG